MFKLESLKRQFNFIGKNVFFLVESKLSLDFKETHLAADYLICL